MMKKSTTYFLATSLMLPLILVGGYLGFQSLFGKLPVIGPYVKVKGKYELVKTPEWAFTNQDNELFSSSQLEGKIVVLNFFFTSCPQICPAMNRNVQKVQQVFIQNEDVQFVSITVDPERDTPEKLKAYEEIYSLNKGQWNFLTGNENDIYILARKGYNLSATDASGDGENDVIHSQTVLLIDPNQQIRGRYSGTDVESMGDIVADISKLRKEFKL